MTIANLLLVYEDESVTVAALLNKMKSIIVGIQGEAVCVAKHNCGVLS
jgi:hypothetical protein